jgi:hypothetical protein
MMAGIEAHIFDQAKQTAAVELYSALKDAGFENHWIKVPVQRPDVADAIVIIIGSKE